MKELSIEEKAKAYDEAIKQIKECTPDENGFITIYPQEIFPKLKESEDERIRKAITEYLRQRLDRSPSIPAAIGSWIAWLEKQGEQKKYYDTCDSFMMDNKKSTCSEKRDFGYFEEKSTNKVEPKFKVGNYIERKDGLGCHAKIIFVRGNVYGCEKIIYQEDSSPFFELMFENQDEFRVSSDFQQKSAWSEEDEKMLNHIIGLLEGLPNLHNWLKSLKGRVQPKNHWKPSKEQMEALAWALSLAKNCGEEMAFDLRTLQDQLKKLTEE